MPRNEEGEFELVLGNRQLLSGFFIVVILFGVFFTMGYIVGRHSSPPVVATALPPVQAAVRSERAVDPPPPPVETARTEGPPAEAPPTTTAAALPAHQDPPEPKREEPKERPTPSAPRTAETPSAGVASGTYLQVAAPKRAAAEGVVAALKKRDIIATMLPGPDENTVRVVVGPFKDAAAIGKMRTELETAGFKPFIKKVN
jgi:hypothetical protein